MLGKPSRPALREASLMSHVTIHIEPQGQGNDDFWLKLIEANGNETGPTVLTRTALTAGRWTANLSQASRPALSDIVTRVSGAGRAARDHADYREIADTLY